MRFSNDNDPFLPGCRYKLRIDTAPLNSGGECLAQASELSFIESFVRGRFGARPRNQPAAHGSAEP